MTITADEDDPYCVRELITRELDSQRHSLQARPVMVPADSAAG
jgi:hypothetical protein